MTPRAHWRNGDDAISVVTPSASWTTADPYTVASATHGR
jgi:hypothetical protein